MEAGQGHTRYAAVLLMVSVVSGKQPHLMESHRRHGPSRYMPRVGHVLRSAVLVGSSVRDCFMGIFDALPLRWHLLLQIPDMMYRHAPSLVPMMEHGEVLIFRDHSVHWRHRAAA